MIERPPEAVWFGLERKATAETWERCENPEWGRASHWWEVGKVEPEEIAARFGAGFYRVVWARKDRRRVLSSSAPFKVGEQVPAPAPPAPEPAATLGATAEPSAFAGLELDPGTVPVMLPGGPTGPADLHLLSKEARELVTLFDLLDRQHQRSKAADWMQWQRMQSAEQSRHHEALKDAQQRHERQLLETRAFYDEMQKAREGVRLQAAAGMAGSGEVTTALATVAQQVAAIQTRLNEEDTEFDAEQMMAKLSDNPNDLERMLTGAQRVVSTVLSSPLGQALAARVQESSGFVPPPAPEGGE